MGANRRNPRFNSRRNRHRSEGIVEKLKAKIEDIKYDMEYNKEKKIENKKQKEKDKYNSKVLKVETDEIDKTVLKEYEIPVIVANEDAFENPKIKPKKVFADSDFVIQKNTEKENLKTKKEVIKKEKELEKFIPKKVEHVSKISMQKEMQDKKEEKENNKIIGISASIAAILVIVVLGVLLYENISPKLAKKEKPNTDKVVIETNSKVETSEGEHLVTEEQKQNFIKEMELVPKEKTGLKLTFLGDIMLGGNAFKKVTEAYSLSFKDIAYMTSKADYTIANFTTVIDDKNPEQTYSKYITSKSAISALRALGVDVVNLANDHILDYGRTSLFNTVKILKDNLLKVYGVDDSTCYLQKNDIKVALVTANDVVLGTRSSYEDANIAMYSREKLQKDIAEAKQNANLVIVSLHYGLENRHIVTARMKEMAKEAIDLGADMVIGNHAMGVLPVEIYNGKPIMYSIGHLISDVTSEYAKQTATFDIQISEDCKIESIVMNPVYITETETVKCEGYKLVQFLEDLDKGCKELGTPVTIENDKVVVKLK